MVYCGKPSKGCEGCRVRKTKCDLARPSCGQCLRTRRRCTGYRNELDLSFRNESTTVIRKARARSARSRTDSVQAESSQSRIAVVVPELFDGQSSLSPVSPTTQYKDMAIPFFISHHIIPETERSKGCMDYTIRILHSDDNKSRISPLTAAVQAVGLATYANIVQAPRILRIAVKEYMRALRLTNISLSSPTEAVKETVLLSVILLSTFEAITCTGNKNLVAWNNHVKGSIQLLYLRGPKQFDTSDGLAMWHLLIANIVSSCIQRQCHVPQSLIKLRKHIKGNIDTTSFHWKSTELMIRWVNLMADLRLRKLVGQTFIDAAAALDNDCVTHFSKPELPEEMKFHCVYVNAPKELVYQDYYLVYTDWHKGSQWNHSRLCRIYLNQMIHNEGRRVLHQQRHILTAKRRQEMEETLTKTSTILAQMAMEVCASVPHIMGYSSSLPLSPIPPKTRFSYIVEDYQVASFQAEEENERDSASQATGTHSFVEDVFKISHQPPSTTSAMSLLWPLYAVGSFESYSLELRYWIINRLEYLGRTLGSGQALMIARALRDRGRIKMYKSDIEELMGPLPKTAMVEEDVDDEDAPGSETERRNLKTEEEFSFEAEVRPVDL